MPLDNVLLILKNGEQMSVPEDEPQNETPDAEEQTEPQATEASDEKAREVRLPNMFWALVPILCMTALMIYV